MLAKKKNMNLVKIKAFLKISSLIVFSFIFGMIISSLKSDLFDPPYYHIDEVLSISRSPEWKFGKGFYVAVIKLEKEKSHIKGVCKIHVGNHNYFTHINLGKAKSMKEAYSLWGDTQWTNDAFIIGKDKDHQITVMRKKIENHR